jgi:hypothetical protein
MVRPHIRRRADSGNGTRHVHRATRAVDVPCKQLVPPAAVKKEEECVEGVLVVQQLRTVEWTGNIVDAQNGCARTTL